MGSMAKQPTSSSGVLVVEPAPVCVSIVPDCSGLIWPSRQVSVTSSSTDRWAEAKFMARMTAVSDRPVALRFLLVLESPVLES
jgi:hypothetical protein